MQAIELGQEFKVLYSVGRIGSGHEGSLGQVDKGLASLLLCLHRQVFVPNAVMCMSV